MRTLRASSGDWTDPCGGGGWKDWKDPCGGGVILSCAIMRSIHSNFILRCASLPCWRSWLPNASSSIGMTAAFPALGIIELLAASSELTRATVKKERPLNFGVHIRSLRLAFWTHKRTHRSIIRLRAWVTSTLQFGTPRIRLRAWVTSTLQFGTPRIYTVS